jgi:hypothetical protein
MKQEILIVRLEARDFSRVRFTKLKDYYKRTEVENIYWEIYKDTPEYKNYCLGVAHGLHIIYDFINIYKDQVDDNKEWLKAIKDAVVQEEKISEYFDRLLKKN